MNQTEYIGSTDQFVEWALQQFRYTDRTSSLIYKKLASDAHRKAVNETAGRSYVQLKINTGAALPSPVVIELFEDICPKTCENFRKLCEGFKPEGSQEAIGYSGTEIHRVVKGMYVQAGDLNKAHGFQAAGYSIYGNEFADESFQVKHTEAGLVGMCKKNGKAHSNECQFYVTLGAPLSFLDNQCVIFGRVVEGFRVFKLIEKMETMNEYPHPPVTIQDAGKFGIEKKSIIKQTPTN